MRRNFFVFVTMLCLLAAAAFGQNWGGGRVPRDGACFYSEPGFRGDMFCANTGEAISGVPHGWKDRTSSIQIFGRAVVTVFDKFDFRGDHDIIDRSVPNLHDIRKSADRDHTWNDRIESVRIDFASGWRDDRDRDHDRDRDDLAFRWGRGPQPRDGACFFRQAEFRGDYFCVERGRSVAALPREFNDAISSVRVFGNARVMIFQNADFRGPKAGIGRDIRDLRDRHNRGGDWDRDWNDRISSIQVR